MPNVKTMKARFIYDIPERQQPATQELKDGVSWVILHPFWFVRPTGEVIFVPPSGYFESTAISIPAWVSDGGSIPKIFQNIFSPVKYLGSYLLHDWLYASESKSRGEADYILLEALKAQGANWLTRQTIYRAVRAGGWVVWNKHKKSKVESLRSWGKECRSSYMMP
jgi:hypothetical protein